MYHFNCAEGFDRYGRDVDVGGSLGRLGTELDSFLEHSVANPASCLEDGSATEDAMLALLENIQPIRHLDVFSCTLVDNLDELRKVYSAITKAVVLCRYVIETQRKPVSGIDTRNDVPLVFELIQALIDCRESLSALVLRFKTRQAVAESAPVVNIYVPEREESVLKDVERFTEGFDPQYAERAREFVEMQIATSRAMQEIAFSYLKARDSSLNGMRCLSQPMHC